MASGIPGWNGQDHVLTVCDIEVEWKSRVSVEAGQETTERILVLLIQRDDV